MKKYLAIGLALALAAPAVADPQKPLVIKGGQTRQLPAGDTLIVNPGTSGAASVNIPHGAAPSSPSNGDCWTTTAGYFCRIDGVTFNMTQAQLANPNGTLGIANGGTGATSASAARTALGLGTAATQNTGTSGSNVPLLDGTNTWAGGQTIQNNLSVTRTGATTSVLVSSDAGQGSAITLRSGSLKRWEIGKGATAESGSDAGSDFYINRYTDAGGFISSALTISRATGTVTLGAALPVGSGGTGATSATGATGNLQYLSGGTGAVARSVSSKLGDVISVKDFGAVCNNSTNDAAAINAALTYAGSLGGGIVQLPGTGLCRVNSTLIVPAYVTLEGVGVGVNSGLSAGATNLLPMVNLSANYASIRSMYIDAGTAGVNTSGVVIRTNAITSPIIRDLQIDRSCGAIEVNGILADVSNVYAYNSEGTSCSVISVGNATTLSGTVNAKFDHVQVTSVNTANRPAYCWDIKDAGGLYITHSDGIYCNVGTAIRPSTNQQVSWATFDNTYLGDTNGSTGFLIDPGAASAHVKGINCNACWASSATGPGVHIRNTPGATMDAINFTALRAFGTGGNAVTLQASANVRISDSFLCGYATSGIFADSGAGNFQVADSVIRPNCAGQSSAGVYGILFAGTNADVSLSNLDVRSNATAEIAGVPTGNSQVSNITSLTNVFGSKASAATVTLDQIGDKWTISGTTTINTLAGGWNGREVTLVTTGGAVSFTGGNMCAAYTSVANVPIKAVYSGTCWYLK